MVQLQAAAIVVFKGPVEHCRVGKTFCFQSPYKVDVLLLVDKGFLFFSFRALADAFDWVLVLAHQSDAFCEKRFPWRMTFSAVQQSIHAIIIFGIFGNTGWELFQNFFYRLYRLSPSVNV